MKVMCAEPLVRVLHADDDRILRSSLRRWLRRHAIEVISEAANGEDALSATLVLRPEVVLVDVYMQPMDGLEFTREIVDRELPVSVVILTAGAVDLEAQSRAAGAVAFFQKPATTNRFLTAIRVMRE